MFGCYLLKACSSLIRDRKGADLDERRGREELGEVERGETVLRLYCMRKESVLNRRGTSKVKKQREFNVVITLALR